ncbi:MAG TPA: glycosyltransferase [Polyangia bacterium]
MNAQVGAVAIGRNEGARLQRCLTSLVGEVGLVIYVDSGSTDESVAMARRLGAVVVEIERGVPFTAARARNLGFAKLRATAPALALVQFVDGDCEVDPGWWARAVRAIDENPQLAVACGRRRERFPDASPYNRLCDLEWDTPVGFADSCGGDALMRVAAVERVGGYNSDLIAGEEPDLCLRLRQSGWKIARLDAEMTLHDAAMTRFGQWWKRTLRAGYAYAEGAARHRGEPEKFWVRETRSNWFWGLGVPATALVLAVPTFGLSLVLGGGYLVLAARTYQATRRRGVSAAEARLYTVACVVGKLPQALGQALYWSKRLRGKRAAIIEYKNPNRA